MNCVPGLRPYVRWWLAIACLVALGGCGVAESESAERRDEPEYDLHYTLSPDPEAATVHVRLRLRQPRYLLREVSFATPASVSDLRGDGQIDLTDGRVTWLPPQRGGVLEWQVATRNARNGGGFDALLGPEWGIFRAEDVIPRARTRSVKGAWSNTTLAFELPAGWSVITEYSARQVPLRVRRDDRRFDEPTGWIAMGKLGVRRETIAGVRVAIAAPQGHDARRMDMLALLNWTLPEVLEMLPDSLQRLTIVTAGDPMWRGGLSAPASLFLHADRPLISENATSSLLHEVMHAALSVHAADGFDWIVEGIAEYYSIELLRRGRAISNRRAERALATQAEWARDAKTLCGRTSTGPTTALAVTVFQALDREIAAATNGEASLDSLLPMLADRRVDLDLLIAATRELTGAVPDSLHIGNLLGCRSIGPGDPEHE